MFLKASPPEGRASEKGSENFCVSVSAGGASPRLLNFISLNSFSLIYGLNLVR